MTEFPNQITQSDIANRIEKLFGNTINIVLDREYFPGETFTLSNGQSAQILNRCVAGSAIACLTDQGNWYIQGTDKIGTTAGSRVIADRVFGQRKPPTQPLFGFVMVLDSNWLSINTSGNVNMISTIFKYFLKTKTKIHTIPYDDRWYTIEYPNLSTWLKTVYPPSGSALSPSPVASAAISNLGLTVEEVSLSDPNLVNKVESLLYIPLLQFGATFTTTEANNLRKLAAKKGVFLIGEWSAWIPYDQYILNLMNFNKISIGGSEPVYDYTFYAKKLDNTLTTFAVEGNASGYFSGQTDKQTLMTFIDQDGVTVRANMVLLSK